MGLIFKPDDGPLRKREREDEPPMLHADPIIASEHIFQEAAAELAKEQEFQKSLEAPVEREPLEKSAPSRREHLRLRLAKAVREGRSGVREIGEELAKALEKHDPLQARLIREIARSMDDAL